jgi:DNA (cytosine-5)-methyltransferase 1
MGYHRAGFDVTGVDIAPRPRYPFRFIQADAIDYVRAHGQEFDLIHASWPCQAKCSLTKGTNRALADRYTDLLPAGRAAMEATGRPFVIENPEARADVVLCGANLGLGVIRHRRIELGGWTAPQPRHERHNGYVRGWRHGVYRDGPYLAAYGAGGGKATIPEMQAAMGIDWTDVREELTEALPPAYTEWIGRAFLAQRTCPLRPVQGALFEVVPE